MVKGLLLTAVLCGWALAAAVPAGEAAGVTDAGEVKQQDNTPLIRFRETSHNFGTAAQNTKLKHTFVFTNQGTDVLKIEKVKAG